MLVIVTETNDVLAITESWIHVDTRYFSLEYTIPGYKMMHKDRTRREGGGVIIFVKDLLQYIGWNVWSDHELIGVDLKLGFATYWLFLVYKANTPVPG